MVSANKLFAGAAFTLGIIIAVCQYGPSYATQQQSSSIGPAPITVSITTGGGIFGPPRDRYRVGEGVPVVISMMNNSDEPAQLCDSDSVYQDRPKLLKDGQLLPYLVDQTQILGGIKSDRACLELNMPEPVSLKPKESRVVDWFTLAEGSEPTGAMAWYEPLRPGKYQLSIDRRLGCCDGPMLPSNKINFEVVP